MVAGGFPDTTMSKYKSLPKIKKENGNCIFSRCFHKHRGWVLSHQEAHSSPYSSLNSKYCFSYISYLKIICNIKLYLGHKKQESQPAFFQLERCPSYPGLNVIQSSPVCQLRRRRKIILVAQIFLSYRKANSPQAYY